MHFLDRLDLLGEALMRLLTRESQKQRCGRSHGFGVLEGFMGFDEVIHGFMIKVFVVIF